MNTVNSLLEEKDAIRETMARYCFHFDGGHIDEWVGLFTEDGIFDRGDYGVQSGEEALRAFFSGYPLPDGTPRLMHIISNVIIEVNGNEARSQSYVLVVRPNKDGALVNGLAGRYQDELVKTDGRWRFRVRKVFFDYLGEMK